ncbi:GNAT family N-acetyltransferase [Gordonia sp. HY285]|uniref:GNAT family N-acetyltransferase n=1 Tax=Gordonia liuliyuniae TaxID=2911517 RepID=UPI001F4229FE|nr:GNAT family N-acetyltransferase [Gordonia liuliyuniae]MCF8610453.1 GNAT family N-acetyltransferase [Gordonia liuliyuniae]
MAIDSERLRLRPVSPDDVDRLYVLDADPDVMRFVSGGEPTRRDTIADWVVPRSQAQFASHGTGMWTVSLRRHDMFVGWVHLRLPRHSAEHELELSYRIAREHWGAGIATEAAAALIAVTFLSTDTRRVFASAHPGHSASHRVMRKLGMRLSPLALSAARLSGEQIDDDVEYELLRDQWAATRGRHTVDRAAGRHRRANGTIGMTG